MIAHTPREIAAGSRWGREGLWKKTNAEGADGTLCAVPAQQQTAEKIIVRSASEIHQLVVVGLLTLSLTQNSTEALQLGYS